MGEAARKSHPAEPKVLWTAVAWWHFKTSLFFRDVAFIMQASLTRAGREGSLPPVMHQLINSQ